MSSPRLEVRLDELRRRKLEAILASKRTSAAAVVREMIDRVYEEVRREESQRAAVELANLRVEDVPDPETLCSQLNGTYSSTHS